MKTLKTTWKHIRRSPYQALAAILIMLVTFLSISVFSFLIFGSSRIISFFESKPQVTAFFKDDAKQENIDALEDSLKQTGKIASIKFVSKKEALEIYKQQNKDDPILLDLVTADILPASLEISTKRIEDLNDVSSMLQHSSFISEVVYQKDVVNTLSAWTSALRKIGLALVIVLSSVSIFVMVTIIGFKISQRKDEIEIMRLLSATNWYIRWPFLYEGMFYGIVGAVVGWLIATSVLLYATPLLTSFLRGIPILPVSPVFLLVLLVSELVFALVLGAFSSFLAVLRYLK
jgi:cell division transport system permease protein